MGRYNVNEPKKLSKTFLKSQNTVVEFKPDTEQAYWIEMEKYHSKEQIKAMRNIGCKASYDKFIADFLSG